MKNVLTFPRQVVEFLAKNIMNRMEITFWKSVIGIQKTLPKILPRFK